MNRIALYFGSFAAAAVISLSCSKEQPQTDAPKAVGFAVESLQTKGTTVTDAAKIRSLGIFGYSTGTGNFNNADPSSLPNLLWNREVTRTADGGEWSYNPPAYWPTDPMVKNTFFAYSPHQSEFPEGSLETSGESTSGYPYLIYTVPETISEHVDLLYSSVNADVANINYDKNAGKVKYTMNHALTWVQFKLAPVSYAGENQNAFYSVTSIGMLGGSVITSGRFDMGTATWTAASPPGRVEYVFDDISDTDPLIVRINTVESLANCLMVIPQEVAYKANATTVDITFNYNDGTGNTQDPTEFFYTLPFPDASLRRGNINIYIVKLATDGVVLEFAGTNTIDQWIEDNTEREIPVF